MRSSIFVFFTTSRIQNFALETVIGMYDHLYVAPNAINPRLQWFNQFAGYLPTWVGVLLETSCL